MTYQLRIKSLQWQLISLRLLLAEKQSVVTNPAFEQKHERDADGRFSPKSGTTGDDSISTPSERMRSLPIAPDIESAIAELQTGVDTSLASASQVWLQGSLQKVAESTLKSLKLTQKAIDDFPKDAASGSIGAVLDDVTFAIGGPLVAVIQAVLSALTSVVQDGPTVLQVPKDDDIKQDPKIDEALKAIGLDPRAVKDAADRLTDLSAAKKSGAGVNLAAHNKNAARFLQRVKELPQAVQERDAAFKVVQQAQQAYTASQGLVPLFSTEFAAETQQLKEAVDDARWRYAIKWGSVDWRKSVIQAEVHHGKDLDRFLYAKDRSNQARQSDHKAFLDTMRKPDTLKHSKMMPITTEERQNYLEKIKADVQDALAAQNVDLANSLQVMIDDWAPDALVDRLTVQKADVEDIVSLSATPLNVKYGILANRANHMNIDEHTVTVSTGTHGNLRDQLFHEVGHEIEDKSNLQLASFTMRADRQIRPGLHDMVDEGMPGEMAFITDLPDNYMAKLYGNPTETRNSTEMVSMSVEQLARPSRTEAAAQVDREYTMYGIAALDHKRPR